MARERGSPSTAKASRPRCSSSASAPAPVGRAPRRARRARLPAVDRQGPHQFLGYTASKPTLARHRPTGRSRAGGRSARQRQGRDRLRPDAVLRRSRRTGGRPRRALLRGRRQNRRRRDRLRRRARTDGPPHPRRTRPSASAMPCAASSRPTSATPTRAITPPPICSTPPSGRCSARTSNRPAASSTPAVCASIFRTTPRWTRPSSTKSSA